MFAFTLLLPLLMVATGDLVNTPPQGVADRLHGEVARLLADLDSDRFAARRRAVEQLEEMVSRRELKELLAAEFQKVLVRPDVSFEVRRHLTRWSRQLPAPPALAVGNATPKELDALVRQLNDDSYASRVGAAKRLDWLLGNPTLVCPIFLRLKQCLAELPVEADDEGQLATAYHHARRAWLLSDPTGWKLPEVSDKQIGQWVDDVAGGATTAKRADAAYRELLDLLVRDDYLPRTSKAIQSRLSRGVDAAATERLQSLLDWIKPEMVAEFWRRRHLTGGQHLLVGVPTLGQGAVKPSHFDRIDEHTAHCVSGNTLSPGDYPVGEAFPYPNQEDTLFHLVNLPTPRRRMAYPLSIETDEPKRLKELSRRTLDHWLADGRPLTEPEIMMLDGLDPAEVSRFAGKYFLAVEDASLPATGMPRMGGRPSRFGLICMWLATDGTHDAMPGLIEAIAKDRFMPATAHSPYRLHWLAALSIATRDPWPEVDTWLADRMEDSQPLVAGQKSSPEFGATAAAILLTRHGKSPHAFGLEPVEDPLGSDFNAHDRDPFSDGRPDARSVLATLHVQGYRFENQAAREKVRQWWKKK